MLPLLLLLAGQGCWCGSPAHAIAWHGADLCVCCRQACLPGSCLLRGSSAIAIPQQLLAQEQQLRPLAGPAGACPATAAGPRRWRLSGLAVSSIPRCAPGCDAHLQCCSSPCCCAGRSSPGRCLCLLGTKGRPCSGLLGLRLLGSCRGEPAESCCCVCCRRCCRCCCCWCAPGCLPRRLLSSWLCRPGLWRCRSRGGRCCPSSRGRRGAAQGALEQRCRCRAQVAWRCSLKQLPCEAHSMRHGGAPSSCCRLLRRMLCCHLCCPRRWRCGCIQEVERAMGGAEHCRQLGSSWELGAGHA